MAAHLTLYLERALMELSGLADVTHELPGQLQRTAKTGLESAWSGTDGDVRDGSTPTSQELGCERKTGSRRENSPTRIVH